MSEEKAIEEIRICMYPFLTAASRYVEESGVSLEDLINSAAFERVRLRGKGRIIEALTEGEVKKPVIIGSSGSRNRARARVQAEMELLSYPFARILVSCIGDEYLVRRYALSEAKAAYKKILDEFALGDRDIVQEMAVEFGINADFFPLEEVRVPFVDYLKFSSNFKDKKWKLVNRRVEKGIVKLKKEEIARIVQEAIYERINEGLPIDVPGDICEAIKGHIEDIRKLLGEKKKKLELDSDFLFSRSTMSSITIDPSCFPPCISRILNNIKEGINVPHTARFAITAFLLNIGMKEEEVMAIYRKSLDFDEERTRYQVSHIAGSKGGVAYTAPSCATMRTYGNCEGKDEICEKISHPLSYYRLGLKQKQK